MTNQTIKHHLEDIKSELESRGVDFSDDGCGEYKERILIGHVDAALRMVDKPMKSAEEWAEKLKEHSGFGDFGCKGCLDIIRAIQADAHLSQDPRLEAAEKMREALVSAKTSLKSASRQLTEQHKYILKGKEWAQSSIDEIQQAIAAYDAACGKGNADE